MASIGVEVKLKNGKKEWFDPVDENEFNLMLGQATEKYLINNGLYDYDFNVCDVEEIFTYEIYGCCGFDKRTGHGPKCVNFGDN